MFKITSVMKLIVFMSLWALIECNPFDDGRYDPRKYSIFDDGKYDRPLDEGKYIPGDEGRYNYTIGNALYPEDNRIYPYIHQEGPNGDFGGNGGYGGNGGNGGPGGPDGPDGPDGPGWLPTKIDYIGNRTYAHRYPHIFKVIDSITMKYESIKFGESESSINYVRKVYPDNEIAMTCQYLQPMKNEVQPNSEFTSQYPPTLKLPNGEKFGSYYSHRGTKVLKTVADGHTNKLKLEYEVFVRVVDVVTE